MKKQNNTSWINFLAILGLLLLIGPMTLKLMLWGISLIDWVSIMDAIVYGLLLLALGFVGRLWKRAYLNTKLVKKTAAERDVTDSDAVETDADETDAERDVTDSDAVDPAADKTDADETVKDEYKLNLDETDKMLIKRTRNVVILVLMVYIVMLLSLWADKWLTGYTQWMEDCKTLLFWGRIIGAICMATVLGWFAHIIYLKNQAEVEERT